MNECENGVNDTRRIWWVQAETVIGFLNRYQKDPERIYGMSFGEYEVKFTVQENVLRVVELVRG